MKKTAISLLGVLLVLLAVSSLPFSSDSSGNEKATSKEKIILMRQIQELNNLPPAIDAKIEPAVKDNIKEALYLAAAAKSPKEAAEKKEVEVLVKASSANAGKEIKRAGGEILNVVDSVDKTAKYFAVKTDADKVAAIADDDDVSSVSQRGEVYPTLDSSMPVIKADSFWNAGYKGSGVRVAVLDTGIDKNHPMLQGKVAAERDFTSSGSAADDCGHGTHVAGIVAGSKANGGTYDGVAPGAQLINVKVLNLDSNGKCVGYVDYIIAAIGWALDPDGNPATDDGAKVISMSLGGKGETSASLESELKAAVAKGAAVVVSSGNCGSGCPSFDCGSFRGVTWPGNSPSVITVGAIDDAKKVACFSSGENVQKVGIKPDFAAPGVDVTSSVPGNGYESMRGTSMAAPHVSGAVALMLGKSPQLKQDDVKRILEKTALDLGDAGKDTSYGFGLIDLAKALIYKEGLVFDIKLENPVISGNVQKIGVVVHDDVQVNSVKATVTKPDGTKTGEFSFIGGGNNAFGYDYTDTAKLGSYVVEGAINYGGSSGGSSVDSGGSAETPSVTAYFTASFKVTSLTGDFGNVEAINVSEKQLLSGNLTANIAFANTATSELSVSMLLQLLDNLTVVQEIRLQTVTVAANSKATIAVNNGLAVGTGNYTLRILTDYGAGSLMNETNITLIDDLQPFIESINYTNVTGDSPLQFTLRLMEHSSIANTSLLVKGNYQCEGACIAVAAPPFEVLINHTSRLVSSNGGSKELVLTAFETFSEYYSNEAQVRVCDVYGNCASTGFLPFRMESKTVCYGGSDPWQVFVVIQQPEGKQIEGCAAVCNGKRVLVMRDDDEKTAFDKAAALADGMCYTGIEKSTAGTPPVGYLDRFDAVVWTTGTGLVNIDGNDAAALVDYYGKKGKVVVEGSDVAFRHDSDDFMRTVLHSEMKTDLGFTVTSVANMSNLSVNITRPHPIVAGLATPVFFNATIDPFPDAVLPYNGSVELAAWSGLDTTGAAMVVYESDDGSSKSLFLPFSVDALNEGVAESLAAGSLEWLLGEAGMDIRPVRLSHGFLVEGQIAATAIIQSSEQLQAAPMIDLFVNGKLASSSLLGIASPLSSQPWEYAYPFEAALGPGQHPITVVANSGFSIKESNYVNNLGEYILVVYPKEADLLLSGMAYSYDDSIGAIIVNLSVSDFGGTAAASGVSIYLNDEQAASQGVQLAAGETKQLRFELQSQKGVHQFRAVADADNAVAEYNESNNELAEKIYICSKEKVLVVDDNDAELFSTPGPSSAGEFMGILRNSGYCAESWDEMQQGVPSNSELNDFKVVVWSAGDYFNGTISYEDELAIGNYSGGLLVEGSDVGLDKSDSAFLQEIAAAVFSSDLLLNESQNESLVLKNHPITANINSINISKEKSPYPDVLDVVDAEIVAEWQNGTAAITAKTVAIITDVQGPYKTAYYAFSVDGITDAAVMEQLVVNTVQWLLDKPNSLPQISSVMTASAGSEIEAAAVKITMNEGQTKNFSVIATDPDGDPLTYTWLLNGTVVSTTQNFSFRPKYNESGDYNLTIIVSDGQAEARAEFVLVVLDTMECEPLKTMLSCPLQLGVCKGSAETCSKDGKWLGCAIADYGKNSEKYEATEATCDGFDNDCDGLTDEGFGDVDDDKIADCVDDDNDNDGTKDSEDDLIGNESSINFTGGAGDGNKLKIIMEDSGDEKEKAQKVKWVKFNDSDKPLLQFRFNFSKGNILLRNLTIEKQRSNSKEGFTLVRGLDLKGETKQVFVDRLVSGSNAVCVKDKEVSQISEISSGCDSEGESLLTCEAAGAVQTNSDLMCRLTSGNGQFQVYGLKHSGIMEACADADLDTYLPVGCSGGTDCNDSNSSISPATAEVCNGVDDNCNGQVDENRVCNTPPELQPVGNKTVSENGTLSFAVAATDNENDALAYNATSLPAGADFDNDTAAFAWTPSFTQAGVYAVTFNASDGLAYDYETINITVTNTNRAPVFENVQNKTVLENATLSFTVSATDPDGDSLAQLFVNVPEKLASAQFSSATKEFKWAPTFDDSGTYTIWFTASDDQLSTNEFVNITVVNINRLPRFENLTNRTALENSSLRFFVNASDPDKDSLTVTLVEIPAKFSSSATFDGREFALPFGFEDAGNYSVIFSANDGQSTVDATVNFTVTNVNRAPVISSVNGNLTVNETEVASIAIEATDPDGDAITYSVNHTGFAQPLPGRFEWGTGFSDSGTYVVLATASDGTLPSSKPVQIAVLNVNRAPRFENVTNQTVLENSTLKFFANATDPDNDPLWLLSGVPPSFANADFDTETMQFSWFPGFNDAGTYTVMFTAGDGLYFIYAESNITVLNVNVAPAITNIVGNLTANETENITVIINASDHDGDALAYSLNDPRFVQDSQSSNTFRWKTGYEDAGAYVVLASASDGSLTTAAAVTVKVDNVNRAPVLAAIGNKTVNENSTLKFKVTASDPDSDAIKITIAKPQAAEGLAFDSSTSDVVWAPTFEQAGSYALTVTATDGNLSDAEEINITVLNVNRVPAITLVLVDPPELVMGEGETKTFTADVSDADNDAVTVAWKVNGETVSTGPELEFAPKYNESGTYDIELAVSDSEATTTTSMQLTVQDTLECGAGQTKLCSVQQGVCAGSFETCAAPGNWLGCSASDYGSSYVAEEKFCSNEPNVNSCYTLCDSLDNDCDGSADEERACNTAPVMQHIGNRTVKENETLEFTVSATDAEPDAFVFSASELLQGSTLDVAGKFSWVPGFEQAGQYIVTFVVSDGLQDDSETVNITVKNVNRAPEVSITLEPPGVHISEGNFKLLRANASDPDGDGLGYKWFRRNKLVSIADHYYFSAGVTDGDENTAHTVTVEVSDGNITANATVEIVVSNTQLCKPKEIGTAPCGSSIGMCKQGAMARTCGSDYLWGEWSACFGEVKPAPKDDCGTWEDDDCDGVVNNGCGNSPDLAPGWMSWKLYDTSNGEISIMSTDNASLTMRPYLYGEVLNIGGDDSPPALTAWYLNGRLMMRTALPRLNAGQKVPVSAYMPYQPYEGMNNVSLIVDANNKIKEKNENNNQIDFPITVKYNETHKQWAKQYGDDYYKRFPTQEECENQGKCWR